MATQHAQMQRRRSATLGEVTAAYGTAFMTAGYWFRRTARRSPGCFPFTPTVVPALSRPVPSTQGLIGSEKTQNRVTLSRCSAFDVRRQLYRLPRVHFFPASSLAKFCRHLTSNRKDQSYIKCLQGSHGIGQNLTLGLLVYVCPPQS